MKKTTRLTPILKWPGGKERELKNILPKLPQSFNNYYEPFIGGGAVYMAIETNQYFINDKSHELINLYETIKNQDIEFYNYLNFMMHSWKNLDILVDTNKEIIIKEYKEYSNNINELESIELFIQSFIEKNYQLFQDMLLINVNIFNEQLLHEVKKNLISKIKRMKKIELDKGELPNKDIIDNFLSALKSAYYMYIRYLYNNFEMFNSSNSLESAVFFFIRNFTYSGMFRYNKNGSFNVPYGGIGYNNKNFDKKITYFKSEELQNHLNKTTICNLDFEEFFNENTPTEDDFIFLDPPYDSDFSTYAKNEFGREDQRRLSEYLIHKCKAKWMIVIKNTDYISELYSHGSLYVSSFDKKYQVSFMDRNNKDVEHLLITNYEIGQ